MTSRPLRMMYDQRDETESYYSYMRNLECRDIKPDLFFDLEKSHSIIFFFKKKKRP